MSRFLAISTAWLQKYWWIFLLAGGAAIRLFFLGVIPGGINQDEASTGYDAWALLTAGIDRNGVSWPVQFLAWGSGQNALYAWLSMPFIAIGGLSVFTVRLAMALAGIGALFLFFWLGSKAGGKILGVCALLVLALNPWHIMASRWALESNILPFVILAAVCLFWAGLQNKPYLFVIASGVIGLSVYAYGTAWLFAPLFVVVILTILRVKGLISWKILGLSLGSAALVALPILIFILNNKFGSGSLQFGPISFPHYPGEARYDGIFLPLAPGGWERVPANAYTVFRLVFCGSDDGLPWNAIAGFGALPVICVPLLLWGLIGQFRRQITIPDLLMAIWFGLALLVAILTDANINRINLIWLPSIWFIARGLAALHTLLIPFLIMCGLIFVVGVAFLNIYFGQWDKGIAEPFNKGFEPALKTTLASADSGEIIAISPRLNMPYMSTLFFAQTPVTEFVTTVVYMNPGAPFQFVSSFGRFRMDINPGTIQNYRHLVVNQSELGMFDENIWNIQKFDFFAAVSRR